MRKRVLITGGNGFLGRHVFDAFRRNGWDVTAPIRAELNLLDQVSCVRALVELRPAVVVNLAATVGGIGANQREPGRFFYENVLMGVNLIEASRLAKIKKFVQVGTVCSYPSETSVPFKETSFWDGYPEPTNAPYGIAKKALLEMLHAYRKQYGMCGIYLIPANLYGPGDNADPSSSHVVPALIRKFKEAMVGGRPSVTVWGTGKPTREFLYVKDAADGIVKASMAYSGPLPVNLGGAEEISIAALAALIAKIMEFSGRIVFDRSKPDGQMRRKIDTSRAVKFFGWKAKVPFRVGLRQTIRDLQWESLGP
jgi:GDP-L-fucose synthase